jgi:hypothetical protein
MAKTATTPAGVLIDAASGGLQFISILMNIGGFA